MSDEVKRGFWRDEEPMVAEMVQSVRSGNCDWSRWKDWVVVAVHEDGRLEEIMVCKLQRIEEV